MVDSIKEDLPIVKFFEKMLEFEAKVRRAQDEQAAKISTPNTWDFDTNATEWFYRTLSTVFFTENDQTN